MRLKILVLIAVLLLLGGLISPAFADEEGQDYGYWCTTCGRQHGPGETCPAASAPAPAEPYDWSQPGNAPAITTTTTKTFAQSAREYNDEGEDFYRQGKYHEAWQKFFAAQFNDPDTPLYKENLDKVNNALKQEAEEKKQHQQELAKRMQNAPHHQKLKNVQPLVPVVELGDKKVVKPALGPTRSLKIAPPPAPGDKLMWDLIADLQLHGGKTISQSARKRSGTEADKELLAAQIKLLDMATADLNDLRVRNGCKDFTEFQKKCETNPGLRRKADAIFNDYQAELQIVTKKLAPRGIEPRSRP
jgi:hypothetical protein